MPFDSTSFSQTVSRRVEFDYLFHPSQGQAPFPTLVFLHGAGGKGNDLDRVRAEILPKMVEEGLRLPFLLLCPQCPATLPGWPIDDLEIWLEAMVEKHTLDPRRLYLTGISMGGRGTWEWAYRAPARFAAIVPLCGPSLPTLAPRLQNLPVWAWHGENDEIVPVERTQEMVDALQKAGNDARFGRLEGIGHNCGKAVYSQPELWQWLDRCQKKGAKECCL